MKDLHTLDRYRDRETERRCYGRDGDAGNGVFKVYVKKRSFNIIASSDLGWEHVSVSPGNQRRKTCPTWEEMCAIKDMFFDEEERVVQYHPPKSEYVNQHPYCLHLWRPTEERMPFPPSIFVGGR